MQPSFSYSVTHIALTCHLQLATKWVETLCPKMGFFYILLTSKRGNIAFPPPVPYIQCSAAVRAIYRKKKPQLWMEGTGKGCRCFCSLKLPYLSIMSRQFWRRLCLVDIYKKLHVSWSSYQFSDECLKRFLCLFNFLWWPLQGDTVLFITEFNMNLKSSELIT